VVKTWLYVPAIYRGGELIEFQSGIVKLIVLQNEARRLLKIKDREEVRSQAPRAKRKESEVSGAVSLAVAGEIAAGRSGRRLERRRVEDFFQ